MSSACFGVNTNFPTAAGERKIGKVKKVRGCKDKTVFANGKC